MHLREIDALAAKTGDGCRPVEHRADIRSAFAAATSARLTRDRQRPLYAHDRPSAPPYLWRLNDRNAGETVTSGCGREGRDPLH